MKTIMATVGLALGLAVSAPAVHAQTFSGTVIDSSRLATFDPLTNVCADPKNLEVDACGSWAAAVETIKPTKDPAAISAAAVLLLCSEHNIKAALCGEATLLELRYHPASPCWKDNRC